jgi:hypothetical protein
VAAPEVGAVMTGMGFIGVMLSCARFLEFFFGFALKQYCDGTTGRTPFLRAAPAVILLKFVVGAGENG